MIARWRMTSATEFVARWQDRDLQLSWLSDEHCWAVYVDGERTRQRWSSSTIAMEAVDGVLNKLVAQALRDGSAPIARQKPRLRLVVRNA